MIGLPDERWVEAVTAFVVLRPGAVSNAEELIAFARERLAGYKPHGLWSSSTTFPHAERQGVKGAAGALPQHGHAGALTAARPSFTRRQVPLANP